jgi:hypothetical protein
MLRFGATRFPSQSWASNKIPRINSRLSSRRAHLLRNSGRFNHDWFVPFDLSAQILLFRMLPKVNCVNKVRVPHQSTSSHGPGFFNRISHLFQTCPIVHICQGFTNITASYCLSRVLPLPFLPCRSNERIRAVYFFSKGTRIFGLQLQVVDRSDAAASRSKSIHLPNPSIYRPWSKWKCPHDSAPRHRSPLLVTDDY